MSNPFINFLVLADTTFVTVHDNVDMTWHGSYNSWGEFPSGQDSYRKILMHYTLGCASSGCSGWDYTTNVNLRKRFKDSTNICPNFILNGDGVFNNNIQTFNYFPILTKSRKERTNLVEHLAKNNIETVVYYKKPLSDLNFDWILKDDNFDNVNYIKNRIMCLPLYPELSNTKLDYVITKVRSFYDS